jgi:hypothetical protein
MGSTRSKRGGPNVTGVYVIYRNRMFGDAVKAILASDPRIRLLGATDDGESTQAAIDGLAPDVILLEEASDRPLMNLQAILTSPVPCRLVTLCLDRDGMHVWSQEWRATVNSRDLLQAIVPKDDSQAGARVEGV